MIMVYKLFSSRYDFDISCQLIKPILILLPVVTIFEYLKSTFIMIYVNIILEIVLYLFGTVCPIMSLVLTPLVYLKTGWVDDSILN